MELTPDIVGRSTGHSQFADPWFDKDHDGDIASGTPEPAIEAPSATTTMPPRIRARSVPPAFDTTFMMQRPTQSTIATTSPAPATMPEVARRRGGADTLLSASWFHDATDAAEWRAVAEEKRAVASPVAAPTARRGFPLWIVAAVVAVVCGLAAAGGGVLTVVVSALYLLA